MVVANKMNKPTLKVSMDSESEDSSSAEESTKSDNEASDSNNFDAEVETANSDIGEDADAETDSNASDSEGENEQNNDVLMSNEGWADSIAKILGSNKPKNKKTLVLSRAKKHSEVTKAVTADKPEFEVIGDDEQEKTTAVIKEESIASPPPPSKKVKYDKPSIRIKPNVLEKDRERLLSKIATKGVVQLFNAVRNQQKALQSDMDRNDLSESKKEKILKKFDKRAFLDTLMGQSKSILVDEETKAAKNEVKDEERPKWSALRDDFMMGAKMKDWDKESVDDL